MKNKKILSLLFICAMMLSLFGCGNTKTVEETRKVTIPYNLSSISGMGADDDLNDMINTLNEEKKYCNKAYLNKNKDMVLISTDSQIKKYVSDNRKYMDKILKEFKESNPKYNYELSKDYSYIKLYFDQELSYDLYGYLLAATIGYTSLNYVLLHGDKDWHITWEVINCHTNKTVVNWIIPNSKGKSFGNEEWNKSYE